MNRPRHAVPLLALALLCLAAAVRPAGAQQPPTTVEAIADETPEARRELLEMVAFHAEDGLPEGQSLLGVKVQILLDRANASPGVIDGFGGANTAKALRTFERMHGLETDGVLDNEVWAALGPDARPVAQIYTITEEDVSRAFDPLPIDYSELAKLERLDYISPEEMLAERFHMDIDLLRALNPGARFDQAGEKLVVADVEGTPPTRRVTRITADRSERHIMAFDAEGKLVTAYPATIGSSNNPSPSGTHQVTAVAIDPVYYYNPSKNFQQGDNDQPLEIPPGPNNPVGSVWIDLSEDTYGIHGTPEPAKIDKTYSHGCVRLTNWDARELADLVEQGATVEFIE